MDADPLGGGLEDPTDTVGELCAHFRSRFYQSSLPQLIASLDWRVLKVNPALADILGKSEGQIIGHRIDEYLHPDDSAGRPAELLQAGGPATVEYEKIFRRADDDAVPMRVIASLVMDEEETPRSIAAFMIDVTDQKSAQETLRRREALFQSLIERASDVAVVNAADGRVIYANTTVSLFGYEPSDVLGAAGFDFIHPEDRPTVVAAFEDVARVPGEAVSLIYRHSHADGGFRWVESRITNRLDDPDIGGIVINLRDVTAHVEANRASQESESRYRAIVDTAQEGIWVANPEAQTLYVNQKMTDIVGRSERELYATPLLASLDESEATAMAERIRERRTRGVEDYDIRYPHPDGDTRWLHIRSSPLADIHGEFIGSLGMVSDVTELKRSEEMLRRLALYDTLTGLPNRTLLTDRLEQATDRRTRGLSWNVTAMFLDVDQFKLVNDSLGHGAGDELLAEMANRLQAAARPGDTLARFGGDEFVLLSEDLSVSQALDLARHLLAQLDEPFNIGPRSLHVTASVGIATAPSCPADELLQSADAAMYVAKRLGPGRVELSDDAHASQTRDRLDLSGDLRCALRDDLLELHYQPIIDLSTGRLVGLEALLRWEHPERGTVSPVVFVSLAEQSGFMHRLDEWVLRRATSDLADLSADGRIGDDVYVSVNVSAAHFAHGDLEAVVTEALEASGLPPQRLGLEVTETAVMVNAESASAVLYRLVNVGVSIALDDFGTGYSSLAYLRRLPVSRLKIDRAFIDHIERSADDLAIVASVVELSRAVAVQTIAEGIETTTQLNIVSRLGVTAGQGFLWSRPLAKADLSRLLFAGAGASFDVPTDDTREGPSRKPSVVKATQEHGLHKLLHLHHGGDSLRSIAIALNREGYRTPVGSRWHPTSVAAVIAEHEDPSLWTRI
jgi:diguanylate cyclase (GGDEF)-like protein/PAS domain S-box-containing protein